MKINNVHVKNYSCFDDLAFDLDDRLTVFVGKNGSGKTSLLNALSLFSIFFEKGINQGIKLKDFQNKIKIGADIKDFFLNGTIGITDTLFDIRFHKVLTNLYHFIVTDKNSTLAKDFTDFSLNHGKVPFVYYTSKRVLPDNTTVKTLHEKISPESAFLNNTSPQIDFTASASWFLQKDNEEGRYVRDKGDLLYKIPELQAVRDAISQSLGDYINPRMIGTPPELVVYKKEDKECKYPFNVNQLSDGYRTMLALIMDLARRLAVANADSFIKQGKSVLHSYAIVLIDEVELHLHPSWQQNVLISLLKIFPNVQFIVTTHSPQVISSIKPESIRLLNNNKVELPSADTYGAESKHILQDIFGVSSRAPETEAKQILDKYWKLLNKGEYDTEEALEYRKKLDIWLSTDPELDSADLLIQRTKRQKAREANNA